MLFPLSGVECNPLGPPLVALVVSFFTSMGGVSGAFLLLPYQMSVLGYTHPSVSATNQLYNVVATPGGVWRYVREGRMLWPLGWLVVLGTVPGVLAGAILRVQVLPDVTSFKGFAGCVLLALGLRMGRDVWRGGASRAAARAMPADATVRVLERSRREVRYTFAGEEYRFSVAQVLALTFVVGIIGGAYGIGGGAFIAPFFVAVLGLPVHTVAGACLLGTCVTSVGGVVIYSSLAPLYPQYSVAPDWLLGLLLGLGGMAGTYLGARCQRYVNPRWIKAMLTLVLLFTAVQYLGAFLR